MYNTGNIAIGKSDTPDTKLDVNGTVTASSFTGIQVNDVPSDLITGSGATTVNHDASGFTISSTNTTYSAGDGLTLTGTEFSLNGIITVDASNNRIGINTSIPTEALHVTGNILVSGDVTGFSDRRLKSKIERIEGALDKVCALGGYTFTMNDKPSTGLIAQEVLEVLPEAVHGSEETHYSLAYGNMIGLLVEAVKELRALI